MWWTLVVFLCSAVAKDQCYQTGPQKLFPTEAACEQWYQEQSGRLDPTVVTPQHRCIGWGTVA